MLCTLRLVSASLVLSILPLAEKKYAALRPLQPRAIVRKAAPNLQAALRFPANPTVPAPARSAWENSMIELVAAGRGRLDYAQGMATAIGLGALPPPSLTRSRAQDTLDAREAALADALRTLSMSVQQVRVTSDTRVSSYVLKSDEVRVRLGTVIKSAEVIEEKLLPESGIYRVVVRAPLLGAGSIAEAVGLDTKEPVANPYAPGAPPPPNATVTGLVIDCRGMGIASSRCPKLYDNRGVEVYGTMEIAPEFVDEFGIVTYPRSLNEARRRVGDRPLIVRAHGVRGGGRDCPVIAAGDALQIRDANARDRFLERTAVVFLRD
jgi:hypothetical protein